MPIRSRYVMATVINPTDYTISLEKSTELGLAIPAERVTPIVDPNRTMKAQDIPEHVQAMINRPSIDDSYIILSLTHTYSMAIYYGDQLLSHTFTN